jgi:hypothetical protein
MRSLPITITCCTLSLATACLTAGEVATEQVAALETTEVRISPVAMRAAVDEDGRDVPGTLVFETTDGRVDITALVPDKPREFRSLDDFHAWAQKTLNARIVEREGAGPVTQIDVSSGTTLRYDREIDDLIRVDDPIEAIVGGTTGYVVIAGEKACASRTAPCAREAGLAPPDDPRRTRRPWLAAGTAGAFGILATSWIARDWFYESVGASTQQWNATSGMQWRWTSCGFFCWTLSLTGSNMLIASYGSFVNQSPAGGNLVLDLNTLGVQTARVTFGWYPVTANNTCGSQFGMSFFDSLNLSTGMGVDAGNC